MQTNQVFIVNVNHGGKGVIFTLNDPALPTKRELKKIFIALNCQCIEYKFKNKTMKYCTQDIN
jgi:hypothetical protein